MTKTTCPEVRRHKPKAGRIAKVDPCSTFTVTGGVLSLRSSCGHSVAWPVREFLSAINVLMPRTVPSNPPPEERQVEAPDWTGPVAFRPQLKARKKVA